MGSEDGDSRLLGADNQTYAAEKKKKCIKFSLIGGIILLVIIITVVLIVVLKKNDDDSLGPPPDYPVYNPYVLSQTVNEEDHVTGIISTHDSYNAQLHALALQSLTIVGATPKNHDLSIDPTSIPYGMNNKFVNTMSYYFGVVDYYTGYLKLDDADLAAKRYKISQEKHETKTNDPSMKLNMLRFEHFQQPFGIEFKDQLDNDNVLLTTKNQSLVFMDKFIQMDFIVPSQRLFGLGDREREFQLDEGVWSMWAKEKESNGNDYDDGTAGKQGQSVHPFVLIQTKREGEFIGIYFKNSNAQSPMIRYGTNTTSRLSYITTGGILEIYFFMHGPAKTIIKQYHKLIGRPYLPPFWSLGWGQASDDYKTLEDFKTMIKGYEDQNLPLNVVYLNLHSLNNFTNFEVNQKDFKNLNDDVISWKDKWIRVVGLLEGGMNADDHENQWYKQFQGKQTLIKSFVNKDILEGAIASKLYGHQHVYPDWLNPETSTLWDEGLKEYFKQVQFDGLVLDKNTPFGSCSGECPEVKKDNIEKRFLSEHKHILGNDAYTNWYQSYNDQKEKSTYFLPFISGYKNAGNLDSNTLSLNATHYPGNVTEYNIHNLYGLMMAETTYSHWHFKKGSEQKENRPFLLSKNTFPSAGKYTSHFVQSERSYQSMKYSISSLLNFNMFGIPHTGTDVCGFYGDQFDEELCARWIQLATFYPVARFNYQQDKTGNEPFKLKGKWLNMTQDSMYDRFQYLRLIYTCLYEAHSNGGTCYDPLFYEHAHDPNVYNYNDITFIVGGAVKISPILDKGVEGTFKSYFPSGKWVNLNNYTEVIDGQGLFELKTQSTVQAHLKPGTLIPFQNNSDHHIKNINGLYEQPITIIANRDISNTAVGSVLLEKGSEFNEWKNEEDYEYYEVSVQANTMQKFIKGGKHGESNFNFNKLVILDAPDLEDVDFACYWDNHFNIQMMEIAFNKTSKVLTLEIEGGHIKFSQFRQISFGSSKKKDLNVCLDNSFSYAVKDGQSIDLTKSSASFQIQHNGKTLPDLQVDLKMTSDNTVNVKWNFADKTGGSPFEVPVEIIATNPEIKTTQTLDKFVKISNKDTNPFQIDIISSNGVIVHSIQSILFDNLLNNYGSISYTTKEEDFHGIMGLGNRAKDNLFYEDGVYSMWSADQGLPYDDGKPPGKNTYGVHPFYMYKNNKEVWVGVFTKLAAAQDWYVKNDIVTGKVETTMIAAGGVIDLFFIIETSPQRVTGAYLDIVGRPTMPPFWSLGWHQSRWGYQNTSALEKVIQGYEENSIPLDTIWSDIDYMDTYKDFTVDQVRYHDLPSFVTKISKKGKHFVPIIDAGISMRNDYQTYTDGVEQNVFLNVRDEPLVGAVWPKEAAFPDWWAKNTPKWWQDNLKQFRRNLFFDGLWLDMNEAANFCNGVCDPNQEMNPSLKRQLKYTPTGKDLEYKGIPLNVKHANEYFELDTHSLFGTMEVKTTYDYFVQEGVRPFILSRSSFAGMGKYGFSWLGDNESKVDHMAQSVIGAMMMNMFGIPFVGSDICGFGGTANPELCARWHFVGAFQPFTRNHNALGSPSQEPYVYKEEKYDGQSYTDIMKKAIQVRYSLINYYYTQFFLANQKGLGAIYKPLFFEFPDDINAYKDQSNNVMIGDSLKVSVLADKVGVNYTDFYFPAGTWCNIFNSEDVCFTSSTGEVQNKSSKAGDFYVHLREGKIVPMVDAISNTIMNTAQLQEYPIDLHILGSKQNETNWFAQGSYFNDDSSTVHVTNGTYNYYNFSVEGQISNEAFKITITFDNSETSKKDDNTTLVFNGNDYLGKLQIYNARFYNLDKCKKGQVNFQDKTSGYYEGEVQYDSVSNRLIYDSKHLTFTIGEISSIVIICY